MSSGESSSEAIMLMSGPTGPSSASLERLQEPVVWTWACASASQASSELRASSPESVGSNSSIWTTLRRPVVSRICFWHSSTAAISSWGLCGRLLGTFDVRRMISSARGLGTETFRGGGGLCLRCWRSRSLGSPRKGCAPLIAS
ncbi:MAG TPA: hypothetical protein DEA08_11430 [Planctomycetes bacterium]|nr:hypothetical protein [Planctomycetota bacterium]